MTYGNMTITEEREYWDTAALTTAPNKLRDEWICDANISDDACVELLLSAAPDPKQWDTSKEMHTVVEIGSGIGRLTERIANFYTNVPIIGMDISIEMTEIAQAGSTHGNCNYYTGSGREIYVGDGLADFVYSMLVFQHLSNDDIVAYISEAARVLRPGGLFYFQFIEGNEQEPFSRHYPLQTVTSWLESSGFDSIVYSRGNIHPLWTWVTAIRG